MRAVSGRVDIAALKDPIAATPNLQALAIEQVNEVLLQPDDSSGTDPSVLVHAHLDLGEMFRDSVLHGDPNGAE